MRTAAPYLACLFAIALTAGGCVAPSARPAENHRAAVWSGPLLDEAGHHRSLALNGPVQQALLALQPSLRPSSAWYVDRLDRRRSVAAGVKTVDVSRGFVSRNDRVRSYNGRVYDDFFRSEQTRRYIEVAN
jgi:hypothetical protein